MHSVHGVKWDRARVREEAHNRAADKSQSISKSGTNDEQVMEYLKGAYQYQNTEGARQSQFNQRSMLEQMGYNTLGAIMQGVYNHIENATAMNFNSTEAMKNREWQEHMSNTAYQRAVEDMKKAGLNPILAFQNGGASTPGGSAGTISGASMGSTIIKRTGSKQGIRICTQLILK